jgi:hypothetical protein
MAQATLFSVTDKHAGYLTQLSLTYKFQSPKTQWQKH